MEKLNELQEKRKVLENRIKAHAEKQATWNAEDRQLWDSLNTEYDTNKKTLDDERVKVENEAKEREALAARIASISNYQDYAPQSGNPLIGRDGGSLTDGPKNGAAFGDPNAKADPLALGIQAWLQSAGPGRGDITDSHRDAARKCGFNLASNEIHFGLSNNFRQVRNQARQVKNTLGSHTETSGGYTFGDSFVHNLELAMLYYGGMFDVSEIIRTSTGEPMRWPTANDTAQTGRQLGESGAVTNNVNTADPSFAQVVWNSYKFTSDEILVPFELLRDNVVNLVEIIPNMLGMRLGRIQNTKFTTGSGNATAKGIVTAATTGVTCASSTAIAYDEIIDLEHSIDPSRRNMPGVGYMLHDLVMKALRKLKDGTGQYLWQAGANGGAPDLLNRRPYTINQDMASTIATTNTTVLFGQLTQYKIRQVNGIRLYRLVERYRENDQDAFIAFLEADGNLLDAGDHPVKKMVQP